VTWTFRPSVKLGYSTSLDSLLQTADHGTLRVNPCNICIYSEKYVRFIFNRNIHPLGSVFLENPDSGWWDLLCQMLEEKCIYFFTKYNVRCRFSEIILYQVEKIPLYYASFCQCFFRKGINILCTLNDIMWVFFVSLLDIFFCVGEVFFFLYWNSGWGTLWDLHRFLQ
jgi:hypothetical protein